MRRQSSTLSAIDSSALILDAVFIPTNTDIMTTFSSANLPSNITTVEQLAFWCNLVLTVSNGTKSIVERVNSYPEAISQYNVFQSPNDGLRILSRLNIPLDPAVAADKTKKMWMFANEMTAGTIPAIYTSN
jgi:hypothetical protein